ncbi:MAG: hypothetical protein ACN6P2_11905 [Pseudomonas palmensis]|uniref:hypothetical protein n=1 Tax=Pseudomonas palmensis TaxID=2815362 RepID=UPI003D0C8C76
MAMINTIVYSRYPRVHFSKIELEQARDFFSDVKVITTVDQGIGLFDIFMEVTKLERKDLDDELVMSKFWGFLLVGTDASYTHAWLLLTKVRHVAHLLGINVNKFSDTCGAKKEEECRLRYSRLSKNYIKLKYYEGWWVKFHDEKKPLFINLVAVHDQYGGDVCGDIYRRCRDYIQKFPKTTGISKNRSIALLVRILIENFWTAEELRLLDDPLEMHEFFNATFNIEYERSRERGLDAKAFMSDWRAMMVVVEDVFITHNIFPQKLCDFNFQEYKELAGNNPFQSQKEDKLGISLITAVPLHIEDEDAAQTLYNKINNDVAKLKAACEAARATTLANHRRRIEALKVDIDAPDFSVNYSKDEQSYIILCKKWAEHPYLTDDDYGFENYFGASKTYVRAALGLLDSTTLLPFIYLLIIECPSITGSWLRKHRITDKFGQKFGFDDELNSAVSSKPRRGSKLSRQIVRLTPKAREVFSEIYELTAEARGYLRRENDPVQHYTFLSTPTGITRPTKMPILRGMAVQANAQSLLAMHLLEQFGESGPATLKRISPKKVRVTAAVIVYFQTNSVQAMSEALGHHDYNPKLIDKYLPTAIRKFYLGRWIRLFQNGMILEAFLGTRHLVEVMDMNSLGEMNEFIRLYKLKPLSPQLTLENWLPVDQRNLSLKQAKGVLPVDHGISTLLICIDHVIVELQNSGRKVPQELEAVQLHAAFTRHALELYKTGELEIISDQAATILSSIELSVPLIANIYEWIGLESSEEA